MVFSLESLKYLDVVWVPQTLQDIDFIHDLLLLALFFHEIQVDGLDGH